MLFVHTRDGLSDREIEWYSGRTIQVKSES
jgi:hypothetical protein